MVPSCEGSQTGIDGGFDGVLENADADADADAAAAAAAL